jgi:hypothetical protein
MTSRYFLLAIFPFALISCQSASAPAGTGAREVVVTFFEALAQEDWTTAYAQVHADSRKQTDRAAFERQARAYRKQLGFALGKVNVRSCDEQGDKAVAQIILGDASGSAKHRYHEGAILRPSADGWKIVLPERFGK